MALYKEITQEDGVTTNYHRIFFVDSIINSHTSIAVLSYVKEDIRSAEKDGSIELAYKKAKTYEIDYKENMTVEEAYEFLKTLPEFEGAVSV